MYIVHVFLKKKFCHISNKWNDIIWLYHILFLLLGLSENILYFPLLVPSAKLPKTIPSGHFNLKSTLFWVHRNLELVIYLDISNTLSQVYYKDNVSMPDRLFYISKIKRLVVDEWFLFQNVCSSNAIALCSINDLLPDKKKKIHETIRHNWRHWKYEGRFVCHSLKL